MNRQEAFEAWWGEPTSHTEALDKQQDFDVWQAACEWQKEQDAKLCEILSGNEPSGHGGRFDALDCADAIRSQE